MKSILIIGGGSIGQRHLRNLLSLGERNIMLVEVNPERANKIAAEHGIETVGSVEEAWQKKSFDIVFVCSPSIFHKENALAAIHAGCNIFIEKPLSTDLDGIDALLQLVQEKKLISMVGSNWKFYPLFVTMKTLLADGAIGKVLSARCQCGQYLPDWHPWEDYRQGYSANKKLGGGILLDSHEFDYLTWFMGDTVKKIGCFSGTTSQLEIDVEDTAEVILQFTSGAIAEIHLDYTQRFLQRNFEFFGEHGTLRWNFLDKKIILQRVGEEVQEFPIAPDYDLNDMYVKEIQHFLDCVEHRTETISPMSAGANVLKLITAAKESASMNTIIFL